MITIYTRTDAYNVVLNSGHRDRFASAADFDAAVNAVWSAVRKNEISSEQFDSICDRIVEGDDDHDLDVADDALRAAGFAVGDWIEAGEGADRSRGQIVAGSDRVLCVVAWDDGSRTSCAIEDMVHAPDHGA